MEINSTMIIFSTSVTAILISVAIILYFKLKNIRYDVTRKVVRLDSMRESLERDIYILNSRIIQNEERWKDMYHLLNRTDLETNDIERNGAVYYSNFLKANGITQNDLIVDEKLVFMLTPFHPEFDDDYIAVRDIFTRRGYKCLRGDEKFIQGDIFPEMLKLIVKSRLIVANINGRNSNVLYELGVSQTLDKPVLLISKSIENLPFDIKSKRFLIYKNYEHLADLFDKEFFRLARQ